MGEKIARAIAPDAWQEFDEGKGYVPNEVGWNCQISIAYASRVLDLLTAEGFPIKPKRQE